MNQQSEDGIKIAGVIVEAVGDSVEVCYCLFLL